MLTQVMSNLLPGFRVVLESIRNNPEADCIEQKCNVLVKNKTPYKDKGTPHVSDFKSN